MKAPSSALTWAFVVLDVLVALPTMLVVRLFDYQRRLYRKRGELF